MGTRHEYVLRTRIVSDLMEPEFCTQRVLHEGLAE